MNKQCECWAKWNSRVNELSVGFLQVYSEKGRRGAGIESSLRRNTSCDQKPTVSPKICKVALLKRSIEGAKTALDPNESDLRLRNKDMDLENTEIEIGSAGVKIPIPAYDGAFDTQAACFPSRVLNSQSNNPHQSPSIRSTVRSHALICRPRHR
jgi:hypothetical protein